MSAARKGKLALKEARVEAGLGREKCSALSGVNRVLILRYENRQAVPGLVNAAKIARVLGVGLDEVKEFEHAVAEAETAGLTTANTAQNDDARGRA